MKNTKPPRRAQDQKRPASAEANTVLAIDELKADPRNANKGSKRGAAMLERSVKRYGAGRSILIDRNGVVIAGNKTIAAAKAAGVDKITVVPSDGKTLIAVQRTDLDLAHDKEAQGLAIADNRVGEVSLDWDPVVLAELEREGVELKDLFTGDELSKLLGDAGAAIVNEEVEKCPACGQRLPE